MKIRRSTLDDSAALADLFSVVFGCEITREQWLWKYCHNLQPALSFLAEMDGRIIAHFGGQLFRAVLKGRESLLSGVTDIMTHPDVRSRTRARAPLTLLGEAYFRAAEESGVAFLFGFPGPSSRIYGQRFLGYRDVTPVPAYSWLLKDVEAGCSEISEENLPPSSVKGDFGSGVVRDRDYLTWRYAIRPGHRYHLFKVEGAYLILKITPPAIYVMDYGCRDADSLARALLGLGSRVGDEKIDRVDAWIPRKLAWKLKGKMDLNETATDFFLEMKPILHDPGTVYLRKHHYFSRGDYDVE